jgi:hypothetical protein
MSSKGNLTREQAVAIVGEAAVAKVDGENCDFTSRVQCDGDTRTEFSASVRCEDKDGTKCTLVAYYYQEQDAVDAVESLDQLDWGIEGYEVV